MPNTRERESVSLDMEGDGFELVYGTYLPLRNA
jgi:hypothetical protein